MDIEYKGGNCVVISAKGTVVAIDPKLSHIGLKDITPKEAVVIATQNDLSLGSDVLVINQPGEYEVREASVKGIPTVRMIDHDGSKQGTLYRIKIGGVRFAVVGHTAVPLSEDQLEALGVVDVVIVPVGGNGYTLDGHQAVGVVKQLDPRVVIPTHYADKAVSYEVPQMELEPFVKELSAPQVETVSKWKIKNASLPEVLTVMHIERTS